MQIGYARVSTADQNLDMQIDALTQAHCEKIFTDTASGAQHERVGLQTALAFGRPGDVLVVWKLDRLARSLAHLIETVRQLESRQIGFRSLRESIDTTTPGGKLIFHVFGALAEFERDMITERTTAGLQAARVRGRLGGRPRTLDGKKISLAQALHQAGRTSPKEICSILGISPSTFYRCLRVKEDAAEEATATR